MPDANITKDQERLAKLWDAYEIQERELELSMKKIATLEHKLKEMDRVNDVLKKAMEDRDKEIRDLELKVISLEEDNSKYEPQINELNRLYREEKERYSKLFSISEELEEELEKAKKESEIKDKWFERNVGMLENLRDSIVERNIELKATTTKPTRKEDITKEIKPPESIGPLSTVSTEKTVTKTSFETSTSIKEPTTETSTSMSTMSTAAETDEGVTFKKISLEKDEKIPELKPEAPPSAVKESASDSSLKNETIYEFTKIPDVDPLIAESLYDGGYTSIDKLRGATTEDLAKIDGVSPTLARKIRTNLFEMGP